ncbi:hypothetical protein TTRE_0000421401 [Trichuris trichiura]|uniref:Uncharacterized protein n=1 Tax=Trichuris trichiura TaxID=36087 RepID=A0A077ZBB0_TRITR|nr:hypothetical protein TTRE_0000421401 [Trichuris trichiura]
MASSGDKSTMEKEKTAPSMLRDHFGMAGMIAFLKSADKDPAMISLLLGHDLTQLGVNLNSAERDLYPSFGGPWFETTVPLNEVAWDVPQEYRVSEHLVGRLPPVKMNRYIDDLLFYFFYHFCARHLLHFRSDLVAKEMLLEYSKLEDRPSNPFPPGLNPLGEPQLDLT